MTTATASPLVKIRGLCKRFGSVLALDNVSLEVRSGEIVALMGRSGSGKTTLLRCIDLLEVPDNGSIEYNGRYELLAPVNEAPRIKDRLSEQIQSLNSAACAIRRQIGFVFQGYDLWEERSVLQNLILAPMVVNGMTRVSAESAALGLCERFGLAEKLNARAWQLSGGQRQRIAIIRALMMRPKLMLFDEITSSLDPILTLEVMELIRELKTDGMTMLLVTHHLRFGLSVSDRVIFLHEGRVLQDSHPSELRSSPATADVQRYLNVLDAVS
jgi:polar amino acid transport system ATP-binding protein